jgi:AraC-like DNA-binding protein
MSQVLFSMLYQTPILRILEDQLLPWILQDGMERFIVARPRLKHMRPQIGIDIIPKKLIGPRKGVRTYTVSGVSAVWPNTELLETHAPLLAFVLTGQADLHCGDYVMKVPERHAVFIPGDVPRWAGAESLKPLGDNPHRSSDHISFLENSGSLHIWFGHQRGNRYRSEAQGGLMVHGAGPLRLLKEIQLELEDGRFLYSEICRRLLELFLLTLIRDLKENRSVYSWELTAKDVLLADIRNPITEAQEYIREHLHEHLTQDKLARKVGLSRTLFIRRFREETGQTFNQFVTACRMTQAKVLLQTTQLPLTFVYQSLGYKSPVHFNTLFRKATNMLPSEFRTKKTACKK